MNSKHKDTLKRIFTNPAQFSIAWKDIQAMLIALGAEMSEDSAKQRKSHISPPSPR